MKPILKSSFFAVILLCLTVISCTEKPVNKSLPRSVPEAEGVSSREIITFLDSVAVRKHEFHSFMFLRHGRVIAEGWWNPYGPDLKHTLYSASKSFTSTAVGLAIKENKLSLEDKVISFFPKDLPDTVSPFLAELKVKHLLTMSVGQRREPNAIITDNWVKTFLAAPIEFEPGTRYNYNSTATYMLSSIVGKVTGEKVIDYLTPGFFAPLGIEGADWETDPADINTGGWGLRLKTEDLAKFGQFYLQKGKWNGKQILPEKWVEEATSLKIYQNPDISQSKRDSTDTMQGYCYQFWRARHNSYMANGAYGQFVLVMPDKDAVVVFTAESSNMWGELNMIWEFLYTAIKGNTLPEDRKSSDELKQREASLALAPPAKNTNEQVSTKVSGKTFSFTENQKKIQSMTLQFNDDLCLLNLKTDTASFDISFASGRWQPGETSRHGPSIFERAKHSLDGLPPFKIAGAYTWKDEKTLELTLHYIENVHSEKIIIHFDDINKNKIQVDLKGSNSPGNRFISIEGLMQKI